MDNLSLIDYLFIYSLVSIWLLLLINIILSLSGHVFYRRHLNTKLKRLNDGEYPKVSILVPAHNEGKVIARTVKSILFLNYPKNKMELIVINDNSSDNTGEILKNLKEQYPENNFKIITTDSTTGGRGKSNALNIGLKESKGDFIAVYDADNTPERDALMYLIQNIMYDESLGAVIGKFRTRNKHKNILTKFINIETLSFQWLAQAGRRQLLGLCTIPGTNFVIRRNLLEEMGGWDENAIAEDTELSFRLYRMGYEINFVPSSVTWEQEPETLKVWFKQRTRWVKGNIYVLFKYLKTIFKKSGKSIAFDLLYFFSVYFLFLSSVIISDTIFVLSLFFNYNISVSGNFMLLWFLAYILFVLEVSLVLTMEKGESGFQNVLLICIMYFTYSQLWILVAIKGVFEQIGDKIFKKKITWYKTERF